MKIKEVSCWLLIMIMFPRKVYKLKNLKKRIKNLILNLKKKKKRERKIRKKKKLRMMIQMKYKREN